MDDDLDAAEDERTIELSSIAAIYPELIVDPKNPYSATLDIPVTPEKPLKIHFQASADGVPPALPTPPDSVEHDDTQSRSKDDTASAAAQIDTHSISHLPPVIVRITLPEGYPVENPPIIEISATPNWVPKTVLRELEKDCTRLWEEMGRDQVVYTYIDHVQQSAEHAFGILGDMGNSVQLPADLKLALMDFDFRTQRENFEKETFDCGICLEPKKGSQCHRLLLCGHVFCVACLQDFYNSCIDEGDVDSVKCLSPSCGKEESVSSPNIKKRKHDRTLNPSELLQIPITQERVQRYVRLKRKKKLEADKSTVYCPRQWCQGAARSKKHPKPVDPLREFDNSDSESEPEPENLPPKKQKKANPEDTPMSERLCVCEDCNFAFCSVCMKGWHGELARCNPRRQAELNAEEKASLEYMQRFSTPCPTCNAPSQKTYGCNHMICFKCKTHFCYLCSSYLMPDNPYRHFNDFKSPCYMRLWELEAGDGADAGLGFGGGQGQAVPWQPDDFDTDSDADGEAEEEDDLGDNDLLVLDEEEDSSDDEPAPDQRRPDRNMHIEIVNFAGNGANQRRIQLPQPPQQPNRAPPPAAPNPPRRRRGQGQQANRQRQMRQEPQRRAVAVAVARPNVQAQVAPAVPHVPARAVAPAPAPVRQAEEQANHIPADEIARILPNAAPGQGNAEQVGHIPAPVRAMGLERFLELALQDQEDEWDSDELEDEPLPEQRVRLPAAAANPRPRERGVRRVA